MAENPKKPLADEASMLREWQAMAGLGVEFVAALLVLGAIGYWIDGKYNTKPWGILIGGGLGFIVGLTQLIRAGYRNMNK